MKNIKKFEDYKGGELRNIVYNSEKILIKKFKIRAGIGGGADSTAHINLYCKPITEKNILEPIIKFFKNFNWEIDSNLNNKMYIVFKVTVPHEFLISLNKSHKNIKLNIEDFYFPEEFDLYNRIHQNEKY